jgi:hypothetical protein
MCNQAGKLGVCSIRLLYIDIFMRADSVAARQSPIVFVPSYHLAADPKCTKMDCLISMMIKLQIQ